jgi:2-haloalkanoic acid dehalogenase type II
MWIAPPVYALKRNCKIMRSAIARGVDNLKFKAVFLDFYGTLVHEDDDIVPIICEQIRVNSAVDCSIKDIAGYWWKELSAMFGECHGAAFQTQRSLGVRSLSNTMKKFESEGIAEELIRIQFEHWMKPELYADTRPFLEEIMKEIPVYIVSNIDSSDIHAAAAFHGIKVTEIITSEDVKAYKPRPELYLEALKRCKLQAGEVIHIGDSITSDVGGAQSVGIKAIWLNRLNKPLPEGTAPDYICKDLNEVRALLSREFEKDGSVE